MSADFLTKIMRQNEQAAKASASPVPEASSGEPAETPASQPTTRDDPPAPTDADLEARVLEKVRSQLTPATPSLDADMIAEAFVKATGKAKPTEKQLSEAAQEVMKEAKATEGYEEATFSMLMDKLQDHPLVKGLLQDQAENKKFRADLVQAQQSQLDNAIAAFATESGKTIDAKTKAVMIKLINDPDVKTENVAEAYAKTTLDTSVLKKKKNTKDVPPPDSRTVNDRNSEATPTGKPTTVEEAMKRALKKYEAEDRLSEVPEDIRAELSA